MGLRQHHRRGAFWVWLWKMGRILTEFQADEARLEKAWRWEDTGWCIWNIGNECGRKGPSEGLGLTQILPLYGQLRQQCCNNRWPHNNGLSPTHKTWPWWVTSNWAAFPLYSRTQDPGWWPKQVHAKLHVDGAGKCNLPLGRGSKYSRCRCSGFGQVFDLSGPMSFPLKMVTEKSLRNMECGSIL